MLKARNGKFCLKLQILLTLAYNADIKSKVHCLPNLLYYFRLVKNITRVIADDEVVYIWVKIN